MCIIDHIWDWPFNFLKYSFPITMKKILQPDANEDAFEYFVFFSYLEKHLCSGALEWSEEPVYDVHYDKMLRASKKHWWLFAHWYRPSASHLNTLEFQSPNNTVILPVNICQQEASLHQELHPHESVWCPSCWEPSLCSLKTGSCMLRRTATTASFILWVMHMHNAHIFFHFTKIF